MNNSKKLLNIKTLDEFESGYWYATDLKQFAKEIGVANNNNQLLTKTWANNLSR